MRNVLRKPAVLAATGWSNSTLYDKMKVGKFPKPTRLDPDGRAVVWFADEVEAFQKQAVDRRTAPAQSQE
jgi:prophage regulatory protein